MKAERILELLNEEELTAAEIAEKTGFNMLEVRKLLMRLRESNKIDAVERDGKIYWRIKEVREEEKKLRPY